MIITCLGDTATALPKTPAVKGAETNAAVRFAGNKALSQESLREAIRQAKCETPGEAAGAVEKHYMERGYLAAKVRSSVNPAGQQVVTVEEGALFQVSAIEIQEVGEHKRADALANPGQLKALLAQRVGEPFSQAKIRASMAALRARYDAAGYGAVNVTPLTELDLAGHRVKLRLEVDRDRIYKIASIDIKGARRTEAAVRRMLSLRVGDVYSFRREEEIKKKLDDSGLFREATVSASKSAKGAPMVMVRVRVLER